MTLTYRLRPLLAIVVLALLALPATAIAKPRDRNHNRIPDKWEKRHGLFTKKRAAARKVARKDNDKDGLRNRAEHRSGTHPKRRDTDGDRKPDAGEDRDKDKVDNGNEIREGTNPRRRDTDRDGKGDGREDRDRDGLNNAGEDAADTDPCDPDSDDDGVKDGKETAGKVVAFDGETLSVRLFNGVELSGSVDEDTEVWCGEDEDDSGWSDDDESWKAGVSSSTYDGDEGDDESGDDPDKPGDDEDAGDESDDEDDFGDEPNCSIDDIEVGAVVRELSLEIDSAGTYVSYVELAE